MSKSNRAVRSAEAQIETSVADTAQETTVVSGIDEQGSWAAELYVTEQSKSQSKSQAEAAEPTMSAEVAAIVSGAQNKSTKIRGLLALGLKRGEVAKLLGVRYQHVRNVEITPVKRVS